MYKYNHISLETPLKAWKSLKKQFKRHLQADQAQIIDGMSMEFNDANSARFETSLRVTWSGVMRFKYSSNAKYP